jgi:Domain of unknown function (DUF5666)
MYVSHWPEVCAGERGRILLDSSPTPEVRTAALEEATPHREMKMHNAHRRLTVLLALAVLATSVLLQACGHRTAASTAPEHIRGTVQSLDGQTLTVATSIGPVSVHVAPVTQIDTLVQSDRQHITDGSFVGVASVTQPDGSQRAVEVHVFPEAMRGTGEGSYDWDLPGIGEGGSKMTNGTATASKMTNGTVSSSKMTNGTVAAKADGSSLTLQYNDGASGGSETITIPPGIPVVAIEPGQPSDLQTGAHVFLIAHRNADGTLTADRVHVGKNGVVPPM